MSSTKKPIAIAVSTAVLLLSGSAFASTHLAQGYQLGIDTVTDAKGAEGNCGGDKGAEGKCGEGACGMDKMDTTKDGKISKAEYDAAHKNGGGNFAKHDTNKDGFISAAEMKATHEGKCGEGKCGGDKPTEGKCGEGKCGGDKPAAAPEKKAAEGKCGEGKCCGAM
jgi:uncharacterized low-complexity protein